MFWVSVILQRAKSNIKTIHEKKIKQKTQNFFGYALNRKWSSLFRGGMVSSLLLSHKCARHLHTFILLATNTNTERQKRTSTELNSHTKQVRTKMFSLWLINRYPGSLKASSVVRSHEVIWHPHRSTHWRATTWNRTKTFVVSQMGFLYPRQSSINVWWLMWQDNPASRSVLIFQASNWIIRHSLHDGKLTWRWRY